MQRKGASREVASLAIKLLAVAACFQHFDNARVLGLDATACMPVSGFEHMSNAANVIRAGLDCNECT